MFTEIEKKRIAILGAGPSGLFCYARLVESGRKDIEIHIFERKLQTGSGMPYSTEGASAEHVTNVSDNEIPHIVTSIEDWIQTVPASTLQTFGIDARHFNEYKVLPRLLFGQYLSAQFELVGEKAVQAGISTILHSGCTVTDLTDYPDQHQVEIHTNEQGSFMADFVVICTGHRWPVTHEGAVYGYYDSPYPPSKLALSLNHPVAIKGSSLTAIDAIRTLARSNGSFHEQANGTLTFTEAPGSPEFKLVMHSRNGLLPAIRFHLEEAHLSTDSLLSQEEIEAHRAANEGFLSLDFIFEKDFKDKLKDKDPAFYAGIANMQLEEFVAFIMNKREKRAPFELFQAEYAEAEASIRHQKSIHWKEALAVLSFAMNQPAKYLSAEDMQRLQKTLMPLISVVIAFVPQQSCRELLALHAAGKLDIISVDPDSTVEPQLEGGIFYQFKDEHDKSNKVRYHTFVNCTGQPHLSFEDFPFKTLITNKTISPARLPFRSSEKGKETHSHSPEEVEQDLNGTYYLKVPGMAINDDFQIVDADQKANKRIFIMAVPYIGGYNPDYSGLDFCEAASEKIAQAILSLPAHSPTDVSFNPI